MRRDRRSPALDATILQIREACRWDCDDVVPLVLAGGDIEHLEREWPVLHAELIDLEARVEATAVRAADPDAQRALDRTWSALIALRSALEAHVRLRLGPVDASQSSLIEPLARTVGIRRDDLRVVAAALPAPLASSGDSPVSGSRDL